MIFNNIKITFLFYTPYECTAIEEYLENMAEAGWLLTKIKGPFFKFKKIKPHKIKYSVDVIGKISSFDSKRYAELLDYRINFSTWAIHAKSKLNEGNYRPYNTYKVLKRKNTFLIIFSLLTILGILLFIFSENYQEQKSNLIILTILFAFIIMHPFIKKIINETRYSKNTKLVINTVNILMSIFLIVFLTTRVIFSNVYDNNNYQGLPYSNLDLTIDDFTNTEVSDESPYIDFTKSIIASKTEYSFGKKDTFFSYTLIQSNYPLVIKFAEDRAINFLKQKQL